ncbi:MAG: peptidylprolyl isomerase [Gemmatimonadales bacterium]|nr:peptidylprolyl isomerase [Gemmatimonadales bacterium]
MSGAARRWARSATGVVLLLAGCGRGPAPAAVAVGDARLTAEAWTPLLLRAPGGATDANADILLGAWTDLAVAFAARDAGVDLLAPDVVAGAIAPALHQARYAAAWRRLVATRALPPIDPDVLDSAWSAGDLRVLQQLVVRLDPIATRSEIGAAVARARALFREAVRDESLRNAGRAAPTFAELVRRRSDDTSRVRGGYLLARPRGYYEPGFDSIGWRLQPGEFAGPLRTTQGVVIVRRPPKVEARPYVAERLAVLQRAAVDSVLRDSLGTAVALRLADGAAERVRQLLGEGRRATPTAPALASWRGGAMDEATFLGVTGAIDAPARGALRRLGDAGLERWLLLLAQERIVIMRAGTAADSAGAADSLARAYRTELAALQAVLAGAPKGDVATRTRALLDAVYRQRVPWTPLPGALGTVLRARLSVREDAGSARAILALARTVQDSVNREARRAQVRQAEQAALDSLRDSAR